jgi:ribose transport system substrate-binding protein
MKNRKSILKALTFVLIMVFTMISVVGCGTSGNTEESSKPETKAPESNKAETKAPEVKPDKKLLIGRIEFDLSMPYQQADAKAFEEYGKSIGIDTIIVDGKSNAEAMASGMEDLISKKVDGIIIQPVDGEAISAFVEQAQKAGIPVLTFVNKPTKAHNPHMHLSEADMSFQMGAYAAKKWMEWYPNKPIKVASLGLPSVVTVEHDRTLAFIDGVKSVAKDAQVVAKLDAGGVRDKAMTAAEDLLQSHPDANIIFGLNGDSALGGISAFEAAGRGKAKDGIPLTELFVSIDGSEQEVLKLANPNSALKICMALTPKDFSIKIMDTMLDIVNGKIKMDSDTNVDLNDVMLDYWQTDLNGFQKFISEQYYSTMDLKAEVEKLKTK